MKKGLHPAGIRNGMPSGINGISLFLCVVFVALGGCKSTKFFGKDKISVKTKTSTYGEMNEQSGRKEHEFRIFSQQDSGSIVEEILIYPIDSFSYVPGEGFSGRASKIIVRRDAYWLNVTADSGMRVAVEQGKRTFRELTERDQRLNGTRKVRASEKTNPGMAGLLFLVGFLMLVVIIYRVWKKNM